MSRYHIMRRLTVALASLCMFGLALADDQVDQEERKPARVAIIGGGIGGAYAAYSLFSLSQQAEWDAEVVVFDAGRVGGRAQAVEYDGHVLELGASMIYGGNRYLSERLSQLGLEERVPSSTGATFSLFDGNRVVFETSPWAVVTIIRMLVRYQLSLLRFAIWPLRMFWKFKSIYASQDGGQSYNSPEEMLRDMGLYQWTQRSFQDVLKDKVGTGGTADLLQRELLGSINRVNYNQRNGQLNGLVGLVSTLPAVDTRTFSIKGGNALLASRLLGHARASVMENCSVEAVVRNKDGTYSLRLAGAKVGATAGDGGIEGSTTCAAANDKDAVPFDAVIIAAPLTLSGLSLEGQYDPPLPDLPQTKYQRTVTTWIKGQINPKYFGLDSPPAGAVFATDDADLPFTSIGPRASYPDFFKLCKLFSSEPLSDKTLAAIFHNFTRVTERSWAAYPQYNPPERFAPFKLADGLYYNNAIEVAASAMEMSAIAGRNSALLVASQLDAALAAKAKAKLEAKAATGSTPSHDAAGGGGATAAAAA